MEDEKSIDLFGIKPLAKAIEKATDKSIDGIGSFLKAICMPAAEEFGLILKEKIASFRQKNLNAIVEKTKEKIEEKKIKVTGEANPLLLREVIEDASWSEDASIQSMWAGLIAVASGKKAVADDSLLYTVILKRLTPFQARLINLIVLF